MVAACPFPYPRGTPIRIFKMAEALARRGHEVHVVTYHLGVEVKQDLFKIHRIPEVKTYHKCSPGPTFQKLLIIDLLLAIKLYQILRRYDIDLIHAHNYEGLLVSIGVRKLTKHPVIYDAHTILTSELPYYEFGLPKYIRNDIARRLDMAIPNMADYVISVTEDIKRELAKFNPVPPLNISVIPNGVELDHFNINPEQNKEFDTKNKILIYTGNLASYQRIDLLLRAFALVLSQQDDVRLLIISDTPFDEYEPLAEALGIREYIDMLRLDFASIPRYIVNADVALNSRIECPGIPQKILNYMAAGKAIVSFEGSAKNLEHGNTGLVIENGNINEFSKAILQLLGDPELSQKLGTNAKIVASNYTWEKSAQKAEEVYERVLLKKAMVKKKSIYNPQLLFV
jgi:glycosyltransferase involved in cell wall biosynthesis